MFRQQAASAVDLEWAKVNNSLFSVTFLAQGGGRGRACKFCQGTDHEPEVCALALRKTPLGEPVGGGRSLLCETDGRGVPKQSGSVTLGTRAGVCTSPIVGSGMSVLTLVAREITGQWTVAARAASGRASPGGTPSQRNDNLRLDGYIEPVVCMSH